MQDNHSNFHKQCAQHDHSALTKFIHQRSKKEKKTAANDQIYSLSYQIKEQKDEIL